MVAIVDGLATPLGDDADWQGFARWAVEVAGERRQLRHIGQFGWSQELDDLSDQLNEALSVYPPSDAVATIGETLLAIVDRDPHAKTVAVQSR